MILAILFFSMIAAHILDPEVLQKEVRELRSENVYLKEQNAWLLRQMFGKKSERLVDANPEELQFDGFESAKQEKAQTQTIPTHERKKRTSTGEDAIKVPEELPIETTIIDIPEEEKNLQRNRRSSPKDRRGNLS